MAAAAVACLAAGVLAACTGAAAGPPTTPPPPTATPAPSPTPTPTPTPDAATPPERPDMSAVDAATAEAVAVYFLELYPYVYATGDLTEWRALSHPECEFCASVIANVEAMVDAGHTADGGEIHADLTATEFVAGTFAIGGTATQEPGGEYDANGATVSESSGGSLEFAMNIIGDAPGWLIRAVEFREVQT